MSQGTILVVEDDPGIREALRLILEVEGYTVHTASNGKEALDELPKHDTPSVILLDLMMPVMDGWAFASALQESGKYAEIPIIVVSAFSERGAEKVAGMCGVIKKPVEVDLLIDTVARYCPPDVVS